MGKAVISSLRLGALLLCLALPACSGMTPAAQDRVVLDRLLALPLEDLVTALGNAAIWRGAGA